MVLGDGRREVVAKRKKKGFPISVRVRKEPEPSTLAVMWSFMIHSDASDKCFGIAHRGTNKICYIITSAKLNDF